MDTKLINYYIKDLLLWIFLIFMCIFIGDLTNKYEFVKHILVIVSSLFILYRAYGMNKYSIYKVILVLVSCIIYLYKNSYTKSICEKYMGYIVFFNVFMVCIPAFYHKNYNLGILLVLLSLLTPINLGIYNENEVTMFNIIFIYIISILYIYATNFKHVTLLVLISIIPMLIKYNKTPWLYRVIGLLVIYCLYTNKRALFYSQYKPNSIFVNQTKIISNNHLADLVFKYNDWKTSKIYIIFIIIGYILVYKTFIFMKKNNIRTFIT